MATTTPAIVVIGAINRSSGRARARRVVTKAPGGQAGPALVKIKKRQRENYFVWPKTNNAGHNPAYRMAGLGRKQCSTLPTSRQAKSMIAVNDLVVDLAAALTRRPLIFPPSILPATLDPLSAALTVDSILPPLPLAR